MDPSVASGEPLPSEGRRRARVTLIRPNVIVFPRSFSWNGPVPPIGLAYVAAVLQDAGHDVEVIDSAGEGIERFTDFESPVGTLRRVGISPEEVVSRIRPGTDVVGITHMFVHEWPQIRELAALIKAAHPHVTLMVGGDNATAFWPWMFEQSDAIDVCVLGEGERTALEVVERVVRGRSLDGVEGIATRDGAGCATSSGLSVRITKAIDEVPRPAWDLFPIEGYLRFSDFFGVDRGMSMPLLATRGCPYKCSFCSSPQMWTTRYVVRDPDDVVDEIATYVERYGITNVNFADLTAITKRKWTLRFCDALDRRGLDITWQLPVGTRAEALDAEVLQRLWDTGCRNISYAPESGSERMLEVYDKRVDIEKLLESLRAAHRIGLVTKINIIVGHPEERWSDVWKSYRFLLRAAIAGCDDAAVMMFGPYPGSADFQRLVDAGRVTVDDTYYYVALSWASPQHESYNPRMSPRRMRAAQMAMLLSFYAVGVASHPSRLVAYVRAQLTGRETRNVDAMLRTKRRGFRPSRDVPDRPEGRSARSAA